MEKKTILLVDDEPDVTELLKDFLELKGYENIETAGSGKEALEIISLKKPRFAFLDIQLSDEVNGIEVLGKSKDCLLKQKLSWCQDIKKSF